VRDAVNGHSLDKERNDAAGASGRNPKGTGLSGRMAALRRLAVEWPLSSPPRLALRPESPVRTDKTIVNRP
jgi:hypothetical protein